MKQPQVLVLALGTMAAVLGIYFAQKAPYTHIAAAAVVLAAVVGIVQASQEAAKAAFVKETLSRLARSVPPSEWWKDKVRDSIQKIAKIRGYSLHLLVFDASDPRNPEANSVFVFRSSSSPGKRPNGLLVVTPVDYAELSLLAKDELEEGVRELVHGRWGTASDADAASRICDTAAALYGVPRPGKGFKVEVRVHHAETPLTVGVGDVHLSFDLTAVGRLLDEPPIRRDLQVAEAIEKLDPGLSKYLNFV